MLYSTLVNVTMCQELYQGFFTYRIFLRGCHCSYSSKRMACFLGGRGSVACHYQIQSILSCNLAHYFYKALFLSVLSPRQLENINSKLISISVKLFMFFKPLAKYILVCDQWPHPQHQHKLGKKLNIDNQNTQYGGSHSCQARGYKAILTL